MTEQQIIDLLKQGAVIEQIERGTNTDSYGHWQINGEKLDDEDEETERTLHHMASAGILKWQVVERKEYFMCWVYTLRDE